MSLLEGVSVRREHRPGLRADVHALGFDEAVVLSTCSRVEIYVGSHSPAGVDPVTVLLDVLAAQCEGAEVRRLAG